MTLKCSLPFSGCWINPWISSLWLLYPFGFRVRSLTRSSSQAMCLAFTCRFDRSVKSSTIWMVHQPNNWKFATRSSDNVNRILQISHLTSSQWFVVSRVWWNLSQVTWLARPNLQLKLFSVWLPKLQDTRCIHKFLNLLHFLTFFHRLSIDSLGREHIGWIIRLDCRRTETAAEEQRTCVESVRMCAGNCQKLVKNLSEHTMIWI